MHYRNPGGHLSHPIILFVWNHIQGQLHAMLLLLLHTHKVLLALCLFHLDYFFMPKSANILQAAEEALESLKSMLNQQGQKRSNSPR